MTTRALSVVAARRQFADLLGRVACGRAEIVIERAARFDLIRQAGERNALDDEQAFAIGLALTEEARHPDATG